MSKRNIQAVINNFRDGGGHSMILIANETEWVEISQLTRSEKIRLRFTLGLYRDKLDKIIKESK